MINSSIATVDEILAASGIDLAGPVAQSAHAAPVTNIPGNVGQAAVGGVTTYTNPLDQTAPATKQRKGGRIMQKQNIVPETLSSEELSANGIVLPPAQSAEQSTVTQEEVITVARPNITDVGSVNQYQQAYANKAPQPFNVNDEEELPAALQEQSSDMVVEQVAPIEVEQRYDVVMDTKVEDQTMVQEYTSEVKEVKTEGDSVILEYMPELPELNIEGLDNNKALNAVFKFVKDAEKDINNWANKNISDIEKERTNTLKTIRNMSNEAIKTIVKNMPAKPAVDINKVSELLAALQNEVKA